MKSFAEPSIIFNHSSPTICVVELVCTMITLIQIISHPLTLININSKHLHEIHIHSSALLKLYTISIHAMGRHRPDRAVH
jgi:hypothetical protein